MRRLDSAREGRGLTRVGVMSPPNLKATPETLIVILIDDSFSTSPHPSALLTLRLFFDS